VRAYTLRGLSARRLRALGLAMAVVLGVSLVCGTLAFTATINRSFEDIFSTAYAGTDVVVTSRKVVEQDSGEIPPFSASVLKRVRSVPGVRKAAGGVGAMVRLVGAKGDKLGNQFAPNFLFSLSPKPFEAQTFVKGHPPRGPRDLVLDQSTAERSGTKIGDTIGVVGPDKLRRFRVVGFSKLGETSGGGSSSATLTLPAARKATGRAGKLDQISIQAEPGTSPRALARRVGRVLPRALLVESGDQAARRNTDEIKGNLSFLPTILLVLAGVVIVVASFLIFNIFSITVAQRIREFGLLRTLGASRRQILWSVSAEAAAIATLGSLGGVAGGIGAAVGLKAMFKAIGLDLPAAGLEFSLGTALIGVAVGMSVTLLSALTPALRATRVTPMAALLEAELPERKGSRRTLNVVAVLLALGGMALLLVGLFGGIEDSGTAAGMLGGGAAAVLFSVSLFSSKLVKPLASVAGRPLQLVNRLAGRLARENSIRKPGRTAVTAASLMIGLALVTFVSVFASGLKSSIASAVDNTLRSDVIVQNLDGFSPVPSGVTSAVAKDPNVERVSAITTTKVKVLRVRGTARVNGVDPSTVTQALNVKWAKGSDAALVSLRPGRAVVSESWAKGKGISVGDTIRATGANGRRTKARVVASFKDDSGFLGDFAIPRSALKRDFGESRPSGVLASFGPGAPDDAGKRLAALIKKRFPSAEALDQQELKTQQEDQIQPLLGLLYGSLALAVIVSLFGIVLTLILSIHERTRELGMLRAIGMSRRQLRRVIRYEAVITAEIGAILGVTLGVLFAVLVSRPLADEGFKLTIPVFTLVVLLLLAALAGSLAAVLPARRAAELEVLDAVAYE
jgi:putative ABC transport system permease protein